MRKLIIFFFFILPVSGWGYIGSGIVINEVQPGGDGSASSPDWIELYNNSDQTINIWDWIISSQNNNTWDQANYRAPNCSDATPTSPGNYTDCDYRIPSDPNLTDELDVAPGCYVVIYNTNGTDDYSCDGDNKIVLYMNREGDDIWSSVADDVILAARYGKGTAVYNTYGTTLYLVTDYVAWDTGFGSPDPHPTKCGSYANESYPNFKVYASDDTDVANQCSDATSVSDIPYMFAQDDSSRSMSPITQSLGSTYSRVPNGTDTDSSSDFTVADDSPGTTANFLEYFRVIPQNQETLLVTWKTGFEKDVRGFNILESTSASGKFTKRNGTLIKSKGIHSTYTILLRVITPAPQLFYKLEVVRSNGKSEYYGPVEVSLSGNQVGNNSGAGTSPLVENSSGPHESSGCSHVPAGSLIGLILIAGLILIPFKRLLRKKR